MRPLSAKKRTHAVLVGEAIARSHLRDYVEYGKDDFPKGLESLPRIAWGMARTQMFLSCAWKASDEEKGIAGEAARAEVEMCLAVARKFKDER